MTALSFADARIERIARAYVEASGLWGVWPAEDGPATVSRHPPATGPAGGVYCVQRADAERIVLAMETRQFARLGDAAAFADVRISPAGYVLDRATAEARARWKSWNDARRGGDLALLNDRFREANERRMRAGKRALGYVATLERALIASMHGLVLTVADLESDA